MSKANIKQSQREDAVMTLEKKQNESELEILMEGRLDTTTAPELEAYLAENSTGVSKLIFNMEKLNYISSAGLRTILATHKKMEKIGTLEIIHVREAVMEVFDVTGFSDFLHIR